MENVLTQMGITPKQISERYAEYPATHDQHFYYTYEPPTPSHAHVTSSKHHYSGGGHKSNAAMSALTLLAFLFFLHILQQCLKEHMTAISTPQVMIMTAGKEGKEKDDAVAKMSNIKVDKAGVTNLETGKSNIILNNHDAIETADEDNKYLTKITTLYSTESKPKINLQNYKNVYNQNDNNYFSGYARGTNNK